MVAQEDQSVDLKAVQAMIGSDRLSFGSAERLMEILGVRPGAVSPLALINDPTHLVGVLLDTFEAPAFMPIRLSMTSPLG